MESVPLLHVKTTLEWALWLNKIVLVECWNIFGVWGPCFKVSLRAGGCINFLMWSNVGTNTTQPVIILIHRKIFWLTLEPFKLDPAKESLLWSWPTTSWEDSLVNVRGDHVHRWAWSDNIVIIPGPHPTHTCMRLHAATNPDSINLI